MHFEIVPVPREKAEGSPLILRHTNIVLPRMDVETGRSERCIDKQDLRTGIARVGLVKDQLLVAKLIVCGKLDIDAVIDLIVAGYDLGA